jgi:hypothetical protein
MSLLYSNCSTLTIGCHVYYDIKKTSPVTNRYIANGSNYWVTNNSGMITTSNVTCPVFYPKIGATGVNPKTIVGTNNITTWKNLKYDLSYGNFQFNSYTNLKISYDGRYIAFSPTRELNPFNTWEYILFSNNGGQSFTEVSLNTMRGDNDNYDHVIVGIAMSANASTIAVLTNYAYTAGTNYPRHYLLISQDYGATWTQSYEEVNNEGYWGAPQGIAMSGDGYYIATLYANGKIRLNSQGGYYLGWTTKSFNNLTSLHPGAPSFSKGAISFDGKYMLFTCNSNSNGRTGDFISTNYGTNITCFSAGNIPGIIQNSVDMSYGGRCVITTDANGNTLFNDDYFAGNAWTFLSPNFPLRHAAMNHDGSLIAGTKTDGNIYRFDSNLNLLYPYVNTGISNGNWTSIAVAKGSDVPVVIEGNSTSGCKSYGTFLNDYCDGYNLHYIYADGNCGTYENIEYNSATCGYTNESYPYYCDCGGGCGGSVDPCYYNGCFDCPAP